MITPTRGKILLEILSEHKKSASGLIHLARTKHEMVRRGKVIAIGQPETDKWGKSKPLGVKVGDVIHLRRYSGHGYKKEKGGQQYLFIKSDNVIGVER